MSITTSVTDFAVASNWGHIVDTYEDNWGDETKVSYSYQADKGVEGSGALQVLTNQKTNRCYDLLVTPRVSGTVTLADLSAYANKKVRIGIHYRSYDTFLLQLDDFTVGPKDGSTTFVDFGNVIRFEIYIDGVKIGESVVPSYKITNLSDGSHTVGIKAIYQNGESDIAYYTFNVTTSISNIVKSPAGMVETYNTMAVLLLIS